MSLWFLVFGLWYQSARILSLDKSLQTDTKDQRLVAKVQLSQV